MVARCSRSACLLFAALVACLPAAASQNQKKDKNKKAKPPELRVENYFGGVFLIGDGGLPNGPCFRINGRVTSGDFFNDLKSYDTDDGVIFKHGQNAVSDFPDNVFLSFAIHDQPCDAGLQPVGTGIYLTQQEMSALQLSLYWKSGVDLRPVGKIKLLNHTVDRIMPYAKSLADELPKRYLWTYDLNIPAAGVPLTDSLVLIFRNAEGHIVARVAARL
jgi:hypothetical protein